jgi:hypothetical protein
MASNAILIKGDPIRKEGLAGESITPGELLMWFAGPDRLMKHDTSGGAAQKMFAVEEDIVGDEISDAYASGSRVQYVTARQGDEIYAYLASGQNLAKGAPLMSNGAGYLTAISGTTPGRLVAFAHEDKDASGGAARFIVEVA